MAQLTLVLPFALPAPEFASDLARALEAPALAALLSRTSSHTLAPAHPAARALPHELWLAQTLGLQSGGQPGFAAAAMRGYGLQPGAGTWFIVNPAHIDIARSHLSMADPRHLGLGTEDSRELFEAARPSFEEAGYALEYGDAATWFMRADDWADMDTASPDAALGMNLTDWMPTGPRALAYRKLQNEVQMVWFTHPTNAAREARRLPTVNAFWPWSRTTVVPAQLTTTDSSITVVPAQQTTTNNSKTVVPAQAGTDTERPKPNGSPTVAAFEAPGWLSALAQHTLPSLDGFTRTIGADTLLICGNIAAPAIAADWHGWLQQMQRLEAELFAPALAALMRGELKQLRLVLSHRAAHAEFTTTALAQRKFWRRPTLDRLI
jgi:hypothetical protein